MNEQELTGQKTIAIFLVALVAFSPLALAIFSRPDFLLGIPRLYFYLFVVWGLVILAIRVNVFRVESDVGGSRRGGPRRPMRGYSGESEGAGPGAER